MNTFNASFVTLSVLSASLALGCMGTTDPLNDPSASNTAALLEQPNGGMSTADEAPQFADNSFTTLPAMTPAVGTDTVLDESGSFALDAAPAAQRHVYRVLILWGHLPRPRDAAGAVAPVSPSQPTDWSGSISVADGRVSVRRTIGFEDRDRVAPRTDPATVEFTSRTQPFIDGMALTVRADGANPTLRFRTAAVSGEMPLPDADGEVRYLPDGRNGVYYAAYEERPACEQGFVFGHWNRLTAHLGVFRGHAINAVGAARGAVRGIWGRNRQGEARFFGKHIANDGAFNGLLGGTYGDGHFTGAWGTRDGSRGELHGRYFDGVERGDGRGVFLGRWREACR